MAEYWWDNPEDGPLWHTLDIEGLHLFESKESSGSEFGGHRLIRFAPSLNLISPWMGSSAVVLVVDPNDLDVSERKELGRAGDRHVLASAVLRVGRIRES